MKIIIYGDKNQTNNSYINLGFFKAFNYLKFDTRQVTKNQIKSLTFDEPTLFIVNDKSNNKHIPLDNKHMYVLINFDKKYFTNVKNTLIIKEYDSKLNLKNVKKLEEYIYLRDNILIMPWGSILTPPEIIKNLETIKGQNNRRIPLILTRKHKLPQIRYIKKKYSYKPVCKFEKELEMVSNSKCSICIYDNDKIDHKALTHLTCGTNIISNSDETRKFLENKVGDLTSNFNKDFKKNNLYHLIENILNNHTFCGRVFNILDFFDL